MRRAFCVLAGLVFITGCTVHVTDRVVAEKYPGGGLSDPTLVATDRTICTVTRREYMAAEVGKLWACTWGAP